MDAIEADFFKEISIMYSVFVGVGIYRFCLVLLILESKLDLENPW